MTWEGVEENYNVFRWYRSSWGRYSQSDPLDNQIAGVINGYRYALSNPLRWIDPTGLESTHSADKINCIANPIDCARVYKCKDEATKAAKSKFGYEKDGTPQNAYKHCYWNCCMAKIIGPVEAKKFGDAHENYPGNPSCDKDMDMHNNEQGRKVTGSTTCDSHCDSAPLQKWRKCQPCGLDPWGNAPKPF
jgi:RHS repeat-associated protein